MNYMYARQVSMELKPNSLTDFTQKLESEILPLLNKQKGFRDEITFVKPDGTKAFAVSLWDSKQDAETYSQKSYADVTQMLSKLIQGTPRVKTFEVAHSTFHKISAKQKAA
jgi:heme-degrading monooxygenase HmoA